MAIMAIAFVNVGFAQSSTNGNSLAVPYPAGLAAGNSLLLGIGNNIPKDYVLPTGWALVQGNASVGSDLGFDVYSKVAAGTETGSLTVTINSGVGTGLHSGIMVCHSGVAASPFGASNLATNGGGASTSPALTALSPGANDWVVRFYLYAADSASTGVTMSSPGGTWVTRKNQITNISGDFATSCVVADKQAGTDSQTITASATGAFAVTQIILVAGAASTPQTGKLVRNKYAQVNASTW